MPTNTFELNTFVRVGSVGARCVMSVSDMWEAAMLRTALETIAGWEQQTRLLKALVVELFPCSRCSFDISALFWGDLTAYVLNLPKSFWEDGGTSVTVGTHRVCSTWPTKPSLTIRSLIIFSNLCNEGLRPWGLWELDACCLESCC